MPLPDSINQKLVEETYLLFAEAERRLKRTEHLTNQLNIPAVNELRYAGYHLFKYLTEGDEAELNKAQNHCKRASYDAAEAPLIKFLQDIQQFQKDYRKMVIIEILPRYLEDMQVVEAFRSLLHKVELERQDHYLARSCYFGEIEPYVEKLSQIVQRLDIARPELNKRLRKERRNGLILIGTLIFTIIAALVGAAPLVQRLFPSSPQTAFQQLPPSQDNPSIPVPNSPRK